MLTMPEAGIETVIWSPPVQLIFDGAIVRPVSTDLVSEGPLIACGASAASTWQSTAPTGKPSTETRVFIARSTLRLTSIAVSRRPLALMLACADTSDTLFCDRIRPSVFEANDGPSTVAGTSRDSNRELNIANT